MQQKRVYLGLFTLAGLMQVGTGQVAVADAGVAQHVEAAVQMPTGRLVVERVEWGPALAKTRGTDLEEWARSARDCGWWGMGSNACLPEPQRIEICGTPYLSGVPEKEVRWQTTTATERWFFEVTGQSITRLRQRMQEAQPYDVAFFDVPTNIKHEDAQRWFAQQTAPVWKTRLVFAAHPTELAWQRIEQPVNLRMLYHAMVDILEASKKTPLSTGQRRRLTTALEASKPLWRKAPEPAGVYHEALLELALDHQLLLPPAFVALCQTSLASRLHKPSELAAAYGWVPTAALRSVKLTVLAALHHKRADVRLQAIRALATAQTTLQEQDKLLHQLANERDPAVHAKLFALVWQGPLQKYNFDAVSSLKDPQNDVTLRLEGVKLLGKLLLAYPAAIYELVLRLEDPDAGVRNEVIAQLSAVRVTSAFMQSYNGLMTLDFLQRKLQDSKEVEVRTARGVLQEQAARETDPALRRVDNYLPS